MGRNSNFGVHQFFIAGPRIFDDRLDPPAPAGDDHQQLALNERVPRARHPSMLTHWPSSTPVVRRCVVCGSGTGSGPGPSRVTVAPATSAPKFPGSVCRASANSLLGEYANDMNNEGLTDCKIVAKKKPAS